MVGDPGQVRRCAATVREEADRVLAAAVRVGATRGVQWQSPAAELFRRRVTERERGLRGVADHLYRAAAALDGHAGAVEAGLAGLARFARRALG